MRYLIDTDVVSEMRKGDRADGAVQSWLGDTPDDALFLSVLVVGELRRGVDRVRRRDISGAEVLEGWLRRVTTDYADRVLPVTAEIAQAWGRMNVPDPLPVIDCLMAATAQVHDLTVATRNVTDLARTGVPVLNPFEH